MKYICIIIILTITSCGIPEERERIRQKKMCVAEKAEIRSLSMILTKYEASLVKFKAMCEDKQITPNAESEQKK